MEPTRMAKSNMRAGGAPVCAAVAIKAPMDVADVGKGLAATQTLC